MVEYNCNLEARSEYIMSTYHEVLDLLQKLVETAEEDIVAHQPMVRLGVDDEPSECEGLGILVGCSGLYKTVVVWSEGEDPDEAWAQWVVAFMDQLVSNLRSQDFAPNLVVAKVNSAKQQADLIVPKEKIRSAKNN